MCDVVFKLEISRTTEEPPARFLFLCPQKDFKTSPSTYCWPDCPAYWSRLGFPTFWCAAEICGFSWDASVYEGLQKFHQAKGFESHTQDLAWHLGEPFYQLVSKMNEADEDWDADDELNYTQTSIDSDAEASDQDDWDVEDESNYPQSSDDSNAQAYSEKDVYDSDSTDSSLTARESKTGQGECEMSTLHDEAPTVSGTFTFLMNAQLVLILFLGLFWLYEQM
ncbi:hypothetical protein DFH08DRAFT_820290 [Mycena albidolilacea]|uniref:Uncharacterized protein n=1 Tax=Mycena albidolilacea TaxID=1033008 RepID=A0AAD6ZC96_9AGAR|nr:hypothetical protein DFH08DRAFT_820290 [Mycena albidolilacea]